MNEVAISPHSSQEKTPMDNKTAPKHLILNSPYKAPEAHWLYQSETKTFEKKPGRRPAGFLKATPRHRGRGEDPGRVVDIPLVNAIRKRVDEWRKAGYPGVSGITKRLLDYWNDAERRGGKRFFFCQLEAVETLIWLVEAPDNEKTGIQIPPNGGEFQRLCAKMATGTGKTVVMAMVIAWHVLNKTAHSQDARFSKNIFIVAPGLTVKSRLSVLQPADPDNYYKDFDIVPPDLMDKLRQGRVRICNWHILRWDSEEQIKKKKGVDKRGAKSDEAYAREALGDMAGARNILVINDEAHHAWRVNPKAKGSAKDKEEATIWVGGLDRIHKTRGILACYDFSATPFAPSGHDSTDEALFDWIISDFSLSDAIESGLVKTPRVVVRDDAGPEAKQYKSRLYHIYSDPEVKDDLSLAAEPEKPLPDLVINAYYLLGYDWKQTDLAWRKQGAETPPVMITVANRTNTAARVKYAFKEGKIRIEELCARERILHIDSEALEKAEAKDEPIIPDDGASSSKENSAKQKRAKQKKGKAMDEKQAEMLRRQVDTVGKPGEPGAQMQKVISVGMLSEGWDAKTVTHIMGLRAFTSQLLCEQVVGRGLRRTSYDVNERTGMFEPEYVNVFGVPFSFLPHSENADEGPPPPPPSPTRIEPVPDRAADFSISWPNVLRIEQVYHPHLSVDWEGVESLELNAGDTASIAELAQTVEGKPDVTKIREIKLEELAKESRLQSIIFAMARDVYNQMKPDWSGGKEILLAQIFVLTEQFIDSGRILINPALFNQDDLRRRLMLILNMSKIVNHLWQAIRFENTEKLVPVFDRAHPFSSTGDMRPWHTTKPCERTCRSHINFCVHDSAWEASEAFVLDRNSAVAAWVKNDHLRFEIIYIYKGVVKRYWPDFIIRLKSGDFLVLETKGQETEQDKAKRRFLEEWAKAVNEHGGFGHWRTAVSRSTSDIKDILHRHSS